MGLTSEQVHWVGGGAFSMVALLLIAKECGVLRGAWPSWLLPILLVGYGVESFADVWVHGAAKPKSYGPESAQHVLQGTAGVLAGVVEALRLNRRLQRPLWGCVLPAALTIIGTVFWFHAQHDADVSPLLLMVQHRAFAVSLFVAAAARALTVWDSPRGSRLAAAWLLPLFIFGLQMLMYTEQTSGVGHVAH